MTCPPSTIANVSCKGRPLVACAGASADIEVGPALAAACGPRPAAPAAPAARALSDAARRDAA